MSAATWMSPGTGSDFLDHVNGDLTGECALVLPVDVLDGELHVGTLDDVGDLGGSEVSRGDDHFGLLHVLDGFHDILSELNGFANGLVHLPVTSNDILTHN